MPFLLSQRTAYLLRPACCRHSAGESVLILVDLAARILEPDQTVALERQLSLLVERCLDVRLLAGHDVQDSPFLVLKISS